jgi:hypothetical protein
MIQEEKSLLLKDLSERLPYGVKGIITYNGDKDIFTIKGIFNILFLSDTECCHIEDFKPYLRSMSSMTEEERNEHFGRTMTIDIVQTSKEVIDWLNAHHFDYRNLIKRGLALEASEGMYDLNNNI